MSGRAASLSDARSTATMSAGRRPSALKSFGLRAKSEVDVVLDGEDSFIRTYTTFDEIQGYANVRFDKDTVISDVNIIFQGQTNTWVEKMAAVSARHGRVSAKHIFMRMSQPITTTPFAVNNIAKAGVSYQIPFTFVVPETILPFVCNHAINNDQVKAEHLRLPPSLGEQMLAGEGSVLMDDLAPAMSKIVYSIRVRVAKSTSANRPVDIVEGSTRLRIIPARQESPPQALDSAREQCDHFTLRREKNVRKGLLGLGKKQGRLVAETTQPRSLRLCPPNKLHKRPVTSMATVNLRFDPSTADEQPPQLGSISSKLRAYTFYAAQPFKHNPSPDNYDILSVVHGVYSTTIDLSTMNLSAVQWAKHEVDGKVSAPSMPVSSAKGGVTCPVETQRQGQQRKFSTSTHQSRNPGDVNRMSSDISVSSDESDLSANTDITRFSAPTSPVGDSTSSPSPPHAFTVQAHTTISPSTAYNSKLAYYTTSLLVPVTLPSQCSGDVSDTMNDISSPRGSASNRSDSNASEISEVGRQTRSNSSANVLGSSLRKRSNRPTFVPTFHNCLVSRTYMLELVVSPSATTAPNLTLKTPIEVTSEYGDRTTSPAFVDSAGDAATAMMSKSNQMAGPPAWYDPFSASSQSQSQSQRQPQYHELPPPPPHQSGFRSALGLGFGSSFGSDEQDTQNDEAIARALAHSLNFDSPPSTTNNTTATTTHGYDPESLPDYGMITHESSSSPTQAFAPPSLAQYYAPPLGRPPPPSSFSSSTNTNTNTNTNTTNAPPPEYYSSFRRATIANTTDPTTAPTTTTTPRRSSLTPNTNPTSSPSSTTNAEPGTRTGTGMSMRRRLRLFAS